MITQEENIFDLLGKGSAVYHSAILTSFTFDPYYFSNYYMPQMRSRGIKNVVVLIDSTQYDAILEDTETFKNFRHDFALHIAGYLIIKSYGALFVLMIRNLMRLSL